MFTKKGLVYFAFNTNLPSRGKLNQNNVDRFCVSHILCNDYHIWFIHENVGFSNPPGPLPRWFLSPGLTSMFMDIETSKHVISCLASNTTRKMKLFKMEFLIFKFLIVILIVFLFLGRMKYPCHLIIVYKVTLFGSTSILRLCHNSFCTSTLNWTAEPLRLDRYCFL